MKLFATVSAIVCLVSCSSAMASTDPKKMPGKKVDQSGPMCQRNFSYNELVSDSSKFLAPYQKKMLQQGLKVVKIVMQPSGHEMGYIFRTSKYDMDLIMGVFASTGEHAGNGGLGDFLVRSVMLHPYGTNPYNVFYEQQVDWTDNGEYWLQNSVKEVSVSGESSYILSSKLLDSTDTLVMPSFSPRWMDAYLQVTKNGTDGSFVAACNFMIPRSDSHKDKFNATAKTRLEASGDNLLKWVERIASNNSQAEKYRKYARKLVGKKD